MRVRLGQKLFGQHAVGHAVLARHDDHLEAGRVEQPTASTVYGNNFKPLEPIEIADVLDHRAVAIEKDSAVSGSRVGLLEKVRAPTRRPASVEIRFMQR